MKTRNRKKSEDEFLKEREKVLSMWSTGKEVDLDEAIEYHEKMPPTKNHALKLRKVKESRAVSVCSMMGTAPIRKDIECSKYLEDKGKIDFLSTVVDSMTRNRLFDDAAKQAAKAEKDDRAILNGLPVAYYGVAGCRKKVEAVKMPVSLWGPSPDPRLVDEIGLAGGHSGISHGGAFVVFYHYTKDVSLDAIMQIFQYVYRLIGYYEERGITIQHTAQGALSCIAPPSLLLAPQIIDDLIAAEQGVKNIQFCYWGGQGSLAQAIAALFVLRKLGDEYLMRFGYKDVNTSLMAGYATNIAFPRDYAQAYAIVSLAPVVTLLSGAEVCYITTVDEAHKIPSKENNAASLRCARTILDLLKEQKIDVSNCQAVKTEAEMIELETRAILERVLDFGDGDIAVGAIRAAEAGVLDQPFSTSQRVAGQVMGVRDAEGSIRYLNAGKLPFTDEILEFHKRKIAERESAQGAKVNYDTVVGDIISISRGQLFLQPGWEEKELAAFGL